MKIVLQFIFGLFALSSTYCNNSTEKSSSGSIVNIAPADAIYFGGDIITMEGDSPTYAETVAVKDGKIVFVGTYAEVEKFHGEKTDMKDLKGNTLLPGFIDSHSHLSQAMNIMGQANLSAPPVGGCKNFADHTDYVITPINQLFTIWSAVNRTSRSGKVIGPNEKATAYQGLKAITINAAYQYFEEENKGSLKVGKLGDFVILKQNPLKEDVTKIQDINVMETIKEGKSIFK